MKGKPNQHQAGNRHQLLGVIGKKHKKSESKLKPDKEACGVLSLTPAWQQALIDQGDFEKARADKLGVCGKNKHKPKENAKSVLYAFHRFNFFQK